MQQPLLGKVIKVSKATAATLPLPALHSHREAAPPTSNQVSHRLPLRPHPLSSEMRPPPSQLKADFIDGPVVVMHHPLPGTGEPLLVGRHRGPRHYLAGSQALSFLLLTQMPTGAGVHPPALFPPAVGARLQSPSVGYPRPERGPPGPAGGRTSCSIFPSTYFSQPSRDRLWKLFLEVRRAPVVSSGPSHSWSRALPAGPRPGLWPLSERRSRVSKF